MNAHTGSIDTAMAQGSVLNSSVVLHEVLIITQPVHALVMYRVSVQPI